MTTADAFERFAAGQTIHGDDFSDSEVMRWYADERDAYVSLIEPQSGYTYRYHALNTYHAWRLLPSARRFDRVLGIGSAAGDEFEPISDRIGSLAIIEPGSHFLRNDVAGVPVTWLPPDPLGSLPVPSETFDLVTCLGTLHHLPRVTRAMQEMYRSLRKGGFAVIREPTTSMGDWRVPRSGLTPRERGIPAHALLEAVQKSGFNVIRAAPCMFSAICLVGRRLNGAPFSSSAVVVVDAIISRAFAWNRIFHATAKHQKLRPTSLFLLLQK